MQRLGDRAIVIVQPLYARANIPETWVLDAAGRAILVHCDPCDGVYRQVRTFRPGEKLTLAAFPDVILSITEVLGA